MKNVGNKLVGCCKLNLKVDFVRCQVKVLLDAELWLHWL